LQHSRLPAHLQNLPATRISAASFGAAAVVGVELEQFHFNPAAAAVVLAFLLMYQTQVLVHR
jgi:uncharacterized protein YbjQ (UPF0145 family)